ncbi:BREX system Lon protease-like protein BrxL [Alkalimarinus alittae]|uniref:BREX system Lon protease-like protein BrxL n=1 Tax=Alkalimarinus alittae TaxID=2961619 RepID=A0ABY6MX80_9ALTE|nr:BREX system Lon protease-like protein BrxL [Alkalimarinus alittae]UZE94437.1 BREX system Lon protease-like protein BrxL [Alkalimarinus alittae]
MSELDTKICDVFAGLVVRKDLVKTVKGNAIVPSYVLEYLLGQYCATNDEDSIESGIQTVKEILAKHYVHRNEANLIRSEISRKGSLKVIDKIEVTFNGDKGVHEAAFDNLGISKVLVDGDTVKKHSKLLVGGVWCISDVQYFSSEEKDVCPWILNSIKPIQLSSFDFEQYLACRKQFSKNEWVDLLIQSIGFNPDALSWRSKLTQLIRLIPFCERNYNLIELGPKGTGKSHIYSEFSPHGTLVSGGEATLAKLFINNTTGKIGLVGYWDVVAMDEFAGRGKKPDIKLIDTLKNYMANKSFNRGTGPQGAEASMVYIGNTSHNVPYMLKNADLFYDLPDSYRNSDGQAVLDRLHYFIPGWEMENLRSDMFTSGYGFVVDYLAEVLRSLRNKDYGDGFTKYFTLSSDISTRDRDGITKTFSGLMKIIFPSGEATQAEMEELLNFSIEGRKRVKDQLMRVDATYSAVSFGYSDGAQKFHSVLTLEEQEFPQYYGTTSNTDEPQSQLLDDLPLENGLADATAKQDLVEETELKEQHLTFLENQRGVCYDDLFGPYLKGATHITITDPYIRLFFQARNVMELLETIVKGKSEADEIVVNLVTVEDEFKGEEQRNFFEQMQSSMLAVGIKFDWTYDNSGAQHARHIVTDTGWKISLDRGLDIYQQYDMNDTFQLANRMQKQRACKAFEVTYIKV